jgi:hypothetical protein
MKTHSWAVFSAAVPEPYHHTVTLAELKLPETLENPSNLYDAASVKLICAAIATAYKGCAYYAIQAGSVTKIPTEQRGVVHVHILASATDGPKRKRPSFQKRKPAKNYLEKAVKYFYNPPEETLNQEARNEYVISRILGKGKAPRLKGFLVSEERQLWNARKVQTNGPTPFNSVTDSSPPTKHNTVTDCNLEVNHEAKLAQKTS